jgi:hypothetical protein
MSICLHIWNRTGREGGYVVREYAHGSKIRHTHEFVCPKCGRKVNYPSIAGPLSGIEWLAVAFIVTAGMGVLFYGSMC